MADKESGPNGSLDLQRVLARITDFDEMVSFCEEIFTPRELKDLELRWKLLTELHRGTSQRSIASLYRISLCKITRGSKILKKKDSTARKILDEMYGRPASRRDKETSGPREAGSGGGADRKRRPRGR